MHFNSRPSARGDILIGLISPLRSLFQFTPLREGRRFRRSAALYDAIYFNSRPSARGDEKSFTCRLSVGISIHAPPRGATQLIVDSVNAYVDFNSRPSARGDGNNACAVLLYKYFNSRPSARGDRMGGKRADDFANYFNSRPSARGDLHPLHIISPSKYFNSRPSARGDCIRCSAIRHIAYFNSRPSARGDRRVRHPHTACR